MNTTRLTNAPQTRQQLLADNNDHYDYDALQTPAANHEQQLDILGAPVKQDNLNNDVIIDIRPVNLSAQFEDLANNDDDDEYDPLDYDRPDKKLAAYDEALERAYLASMMARIENEANNPRAYIEDEDLVQEFVEEFEEDDYDPLDYDRADKTLAAYDEALERAYLANDFTIEHLEDDDDDDVINFEEESNDMLSFDEWKAKINAAADEDDVIRFNEWQAKMFQDRQERSTEFFKSFDPEDMDYHEWLQEQIELHKDDPEFQYNLQLFTYNSCQNERLYATEDAAILDEEDDWDPLDYDRADKKLAAYDEALERAYLANEFTIEHLEDADYEQLERDRACQYFVEQAELHAKRNEYIIKRNQDILKRYNDDRTKRYNDFFKSYDEDMDYHVWLQEQIELHKGDPEFQYNLEIFTYTGPQIERLNAIDEAAGTESNNAFIRECKAADLEDAEWNKSVIYINKPFAPFTPFTPFTIGNDNNV